LANARMHSAQGGEFEVQTPFLKAPFFPIFLEQN
jgi:hypothetical protein